MEPILTYKHSTTWTHQAWAAPAMMGMEKARQRNLQEETEDEQHHHLPRLLLQHKKKF